MKKINWWHAAAFFFFSLTWVLGLTGDEFPSQVQNVGFMCLALGLSFNEVS